MPDIDPRNIAAYDYELPPALVAQRPLAERDASRLLVVPRAGGPLAHSTMRDLPDLLDPGDLLVLNDTRVRPARLAALRQGGGATRLLLLEPRPDGSFTCLARPGSRLHEGARLRVVRRGEEGTLGPTLVLGGARGDALRTVAAEEGDLAAILDAWGEMPLPPYVDRSAGPDALDRDRYQTIYARHDGAAAAPTAGLHMTERLLAALDARGVRRATVTLHVGVGTFAPVRAAALLDHRMHAERFVVPAESAAAIDDARARGGRLVCVGTTTLRALETWHRLGEPRDGAERSSELFLTPADPPRLPAALLTNFHLPKSTLLVLVASILGRERTLSVYEEAKAQGYRFTSYGDASLLL